MKSPSRPSHIPIRQALPSRKTSVLRRRDRDQNQIPLRRLRPMSAHQPDLLQQSSIIRSRGKNQQRACTIPHPSQGHR